ncbi:MAG: hypothetical protein RL095_2438 [Verrucomicrobiota bacterium]|jgi:hypothetical protein
MIAVFAFALLLGAGADDAGLRFLEVESQAGIAVPAGEAAEARPGRPVRLVLRLRNVGDEALKFDPGMLRVLRDAPGGGKELELVPMATGSELRLQQRLAARKGLLAALEAAAPGELEAQLLLHYPQVPQAERSLDKARGQLQNEITSVFADLKALAAWREGGRIPPHSCLELAFKSRLPEGFDADRPECRLTLRIQPPGGTPFNFPAVARVE